MIIILLDVWLRELPSAAYNEIHASAKTLEDGYPTRVLVALCAEPNHHAPVQDAREEGESEDDPSQDEHAVAHSAQISARYWLAIVDVSGAPFEIFKTAIVAQFARNLQAPVRVIWVVVVH